MILVDTSVWVDHLYDRDLEMSRLLDAEEVFIHSFVVGELAMGQLTDRAVIMRSLERLPFVEMAMHEEVLALVERHRLYGTGVGYIDAHLLTSVMVTLGCRLWTRDKRLKTIAGKLDLAAAGLH